MFFIRGHEWADMDIASIGLGFVIGGAAGAIFLYGAQSLGSKRAKLLSRGNCKSLKLDVDNKEIIKIFTKSDTKRMETAEKRFIESQRKQTQHAREKEQIAQSLDDGIMELSQITSTIDSSDTRGLADIQIKNKLAGHLKTLSMISNRYGAKLDLEVRAWYELIFWDTVRTGLGKKDALDNLLKRSPSTSELDTMLDKVLQTGTETLSVSESQFRKTMERYIKPLQ